MRYPIWPERRQSRIVVFVFAWFFTIAFCGDSNDWRGSIRLENGVRIVENPDKPLYEGEILKLQEEYIIPASSRDYQLVRPIQFLTDAFHNLYVLDNKESNVKVFDEHGRFLRLIGSKGIGPAELESPAYMTITGRLLTIFCPQIARRTVFDLEGRYDDSGYYPMGWAAMQADSLGSFFCMNHGHSGEHDIVRFHKYDANLKFITEFASQVPRPHQHWGGVQGPMFSLTRDDKVIYGFPETYELKIFNNEGRLIGLIRKKHHAIRFPREEVDFLKKKYNTSGPEDVFPKYHEPFYTIESDDDGRIIVKTSWSISRGFEYCDVFGPDGRFLATIQLKVNGRRLWSNDRLYEVTEDIEGLSAIRVSRAIWLYP